MVSESLSEELEKLKNKLMKMGRLLEEQIYKSVKALVDKDIKLAYEVINNDDIIDNMELEIEKRALCLIALKQPMAKDLRLIATIMKMIGDIERMADHAANIAQITIDLYDQAYIKPLIDIPRMAKISQDMIQKTLKAFMDQDVELAMSLVPMEKEINALYDQIFRELLSYMMQDSKNIPQSTRLLLVAKNLERVGDHATNLAEMAIYLVKGQRVDLNKLAHARRREG